MPYSPDRFRDQGLSTTRYPNKEKALGCWKTKLTSILAEGRLTELQPILENPEAAYVGETVVGLVELQNSRLPEDPLLFRKNRIEIEPFRFYESFGKNISCFVSRQSQSRLNHRLSE